MTLPLRPFPNPVPGQVLDVVAINTRGNDNLLVGAVNTLAQQGGANASLANRGADSASLYDPRFAAEDGDHLIAAQVFGRYRA